MIINRGNRARALIPLPRLLPPILIIVRHSTGHRFPSRSASSPRLPSRISFNLAISVALRRGARALPSANSRSGPGTRNTVPVRKKGKASCENNAKSCITTYHLFSRNIVRRRKEIAARRCIDPFVRGGPFQGDYCDRAATQLREGATFYLIAFIN